MQYGGLQNSVACVITSCSNDNFASPTHRTNNRWIKACEMLFRSPTRASRSSCSVSGGCWRWRTRLPSSSHKWVTDPVIMSAKEEHGYYSGTSCIVMLKDVVKVSLLQKGQNDRIKNIVSVFYSIQCSLNNFKIMTNSSPDHNTSVSKTVGLVHTLVRKTFPTPAVHTITSIAKTNV